MKKIFLILSLLSTGTVAAKIMLTSPVVHVMDGTAITGPVVGQLLKIRADGFRIRTKEVYRIDSGGTGYTVEQLLRMEAEGTMSKELLSAYLVPAKEDFMLHIAPFLDDAQDAKEPMLILIQEWAEKAGKPDSLLLRWGAAEPGTEPELFRDEIVRFTQLDVFCADLISFLEALILSCKKALAELKTILSKEKEKEAVQEDA